MASFSQNVKCKYGIKSYQDTKNTYDWIMKSLNKGGFLNLKIGTRFIFDISEISCSCENIEEFVEHAYGQSGFSFTSMHFKIESDGVPLWFISVDTTPRVRISTDTKSLLEKAVNLLKNTSLDETEANDPISVIYIEHQDNSVKVNGDHNVVANDHSVIVDKQGKEESKISKWFQGIAQGVFANLTWWILGIVVIALLTWAISKGYIS